MSTIDPVDGGSLAESFHLVRSLVPAGQEIIALSPDAKVGQAIRLMKEKNLSQLPIVAGKAVLGVFSSFAGSGAPENEVQVRGHWGTAC